MSDEFKKAMLGVTPLKSNNRVTHPKKTSLRLKKKISEVLELPAPVRSGDSLRFVRDDQVTPLISRFKRHQIDPEDSIDLHGMTTDEAKPYLLQFLQESLQQGFRCVCVIHGKNTKTPDYPVLKNKVNAWLREYPEVRAFCSAPKNAGGLGAVYVLLNR